MATNPTLLLVPIAENGTKNTLPENQATPGNGLMSQSTGFPAECSLPLGAGGVAPDRADFNGAFNLLSGVAFYAQKGWRFQFDATQDYYTGCIVIDATDGNAYQAINDVSAGGSVPSLDSTNWILYAKQAAMEQQPFIPAFNKCDVITTSGTYTAPVTGWYRITVKGGGGGGQAGSHTSSTQYFGGAGGGEGGTTIAFEKMTAGQTVSVVIGAGGAGGSGSGGASGGAGGNTSVTTGLASYVGGGAPETNAYGGLGGTGTINGAPGSCCNQGFGGIGVYGAAGGGAGGAKSNGSTSPSPATQGGGGAGGYANQTGTRYGGGDGGDGFVFMEYFDPTLM